MTRRLLYRDDRPRTPTSRTESETHRPSRSSTSTILRFISPNPAQLGRFLTVLGGLQVLTLAWMILGPAGLFYLITVGLVVVMLFVAISSLSLGLHAWHTPDNMETIGFDDPQRPQHGFSLMVPAREESLPVLGATIQAVADQTHPDFEVLIIVSGDDDEGTRTAAEVLRARYPTLMRIVTVTGAVKNKPLALMAALPECRKAIVGVLDAESIAAPDLLAHIDTKFLTSGADVVQGGVALMNFSDSWYSLQNCLEYNIWFKSRLHWQAKKGFITFGGNSIFIKRTALEAVGGWDVTNLTEDAELGVRMSADGYHVAVAFDPKLVTREETPGSVSVLFRQRRRWMLGFLQTYFKGEWRRLPTLRQRLLARYTLMMPSIQAGAGILIPLSALAAVLAKLPTLLVLTTFLPLIPMSATISGNLILLAEFGNDYGLRVQWRHYATLVVGTFFYQCILSAAAISATWRYLRKNTVWDKTEHSGNHHQFSAALTSASGSV